ncbi:MAG: VPLPA-CTERM sorting domain-containing protein [Pseudomonadota bacterium]
MNKQIAPVIAVMVGSTLATYASASVLDGQTVLIENSLNAANDARVKVGDDIEFLAQYAQRDFFAVDLDNDGYISVSNHIDGRMTFYAPLTISVSDVDLSISDFVGVALVSTSGVSGIGQNDLTRVNDEKISLRLDRSIWDIGGNFVARLLFEGDNVVATETPLPAGFPLMLAGLGGLFLTRRRQRASS